MDYTKLNVLVSETRRSAQIKYRFLNDWSRERRVGAEIGRVIREYLDEQRADEQRHQQPDA